MAKVVRIREVYTGALSCEPFVRRCPNGDLICINEIGGVSEPSPENRVHVFRSVDNGDSWESEGSIWPEDGLAVIVTEVSVIGEEITAYLSLHTGRFMDWKCVMVKSLDNGRTWQNAGTPPHLPEHTFVRSAITTKAGNILLPYQYYPVTREMHDRLLASDAEDKSVWNAGVPYAESGVICSTDSGKTFTRHAASQTPTTGKWPWTEPTIVETSDGTIVMLTRWDGTGTLWRCDSADGGKTWSEMYDAKIPNPGNKPRLIKLDRGRIVLLHTPNTERRFPLELWISDDDMQTWKEKLQLTDFPGTYNYSDGFYENGHILFTVEHNRHSVEFFDIEI